MNLFEQCTDRGVTVARQVMPLKGLFQLCGVQEIRNALGKIGRCLRVDIRHDEDFVEVDPEADTLEGLILEDASTEGFRIFIHGPNLVIP